MVFELPRGVTVHRARVVRSHEFMVHALAAIVIVLNVCGNSLLRVGMSSVGEIVSVSPFAYLRAFANPWVLAGIVLLLGWLIAQLSLLSWADLSYVLPVTSLSYVLISLVGAYILHERMSLFHWAGVALILVGVTAVGKTRPMTSHSADEGSS